MRFVIPDPMARTNVADGRNKMCILREKAHLQKNFVPQGSPDTIIKGTYYLTEVDDMFRRKYEIKA